MKKLLTIAMALSLLITIGCHKDKVEPPVQSNPPAPVVLSCTDSSIISVDIIPIGQSNFSQLWLFNSWNNDTALYFGDSIAVIHHQLVNHTHTIVNSDNWALWVVNWPGGSDTTKYDTVRVVIKINNVIKKDTTIKSLYDRFMVNNDCSDNVH